MGRASSSKKVARAARAAGKQKSSRPSVVWPLSMVAVVALGAVLIFVSRSPRAVAEAPIIGDHWHAAIDIFVCGTVQPYLPDSMATTTTGLHSHGDGLIHIEPSSTRYTGKGANLGAFLSGTGVELADDQLQLANGEEYRNGDDCGGEPGIVQVKVWASEADQQGRLLESGFADYSLPNGSLLTIAFAPEGADIPRPSTSPPSA